MGEDKRSRGRPRRSNQVRIVPVPRPQPDVRKLGRAFLALALHQAEREAAAQRNQARPNESASGRMGGSDE